MVQIIKKSSSQSINQSISHTLFIEGDFDVKVFKELFEHFELPPINIKQLGSYKNLNAAVKAFQKHHPNYYFLIDRDFETEDEVNNSWNNFPNSDTPNLLILKKRELENYFLDPKYLKQSKYFKDGCNLEEKLLKIVEDRIYYEAASLVLFEIEYHFNKDVVYKLNSTNIKKHDNKDNALTSLNQTIEELKEAYKDKETDSLKTDNISESYENKLIELLGEKTEKPLLDKGRWMDLVSGKEILTQLINTCFKVPVIITDTKEKEYRILKDLLRQKEQPEDFKRLCEIIKNKILKNSKAF